MAKDISRTTIQPAQTPLSEEPGKKTKTKGKFITKDAQLADSQVYHNKSAKSPEGQSLSSRKVTSHNLDIIIQLAERGEWSGLSSAIQQHCDSLVKLDQIIFLLKKQEIDLTEDVQNSIGNHFVKLYVLEKLPELTKGLL